MMDAQGIQSGATIPKQETGVGKILRTIHQTSVSDIFWPENDKTFVKASAYEEMAEETLDGHPTPVSIKQLLSLIREVAFVHAENTFQLKNLRKTISEDRKQIHDALLHLEKRIDALDEGNTPSQED